MLEEHIPQLMIDMISRGVFSMNSIQGIGDQGAERVTSRNSTIAISTLGPHRDTKMREVILGDMIISSVVDGYQTGAI